MVYKECGCRTYMTDHPNLLVPMVEYCPMHEAAPEMLEALELVEWTFPVNSLRRTCPWCNNEQIHGHSNACKRQLTIALAEANKI